MGAVVERALEDARALREGGCDALLVENLGDVPYFAGAVPPETVAAMALCVRAVIDHAGGLPVGVNVLRNDARAALGLCAASGASFLRVNVHVGAALTDQGTIEGRAAETLRERARLCPEALILADVHVKHATPLGSESLEAAAADAHGRGLADALVLTGGATGEAPAAEEIERVRRRLPRARILVGSGLSEANAAALLGHADGAIVGTWLKRDGRIEAQVDPKRVRRLRRAFDDAVSPPRPPE